MFVAAVAEVGVVAEAEVVAEVVAEVGVPPEAEEEGGVRLDDANLILI